MRASRRSSSPRCSPATARTTSRALLDAVTNRHEFVPLTWDDREAILAVLDHPPDGLVGLREALFADLNWRRGVLTDTRYR